MDLKELSQERYSVRAYLPEEVEKEKLDYILECARLAPSACNNQPWFFYIVASAEKKADLQASYNREWFTTAPMYIVVCSDHNQSWRRSAYDNKDVADIDGAIVAEHICLASASVGLGTCWVCNFDPAQVRAVLDMPTHQEPIAIFPIGYVDEQKSKAPEKKRKQTSEITKWL